MKKLVSEKIGIKEHMRTLFVDAPADTATEIYSSMLDLKSNLSGKFDYIHFFAKDQKHFIRKFPKLIEHLHNKGMLWVSWPKSRKFDTDLDIKSVIKLGYDFGLVESKCISINSIWSALKFTWPKENKEYNNSYGTLK
ncbi:MAG: hypothetical protein H7Z13_05520 [Ferruginibacter sp.]|nr:hypothetical protein [Ferruginibacter sp.]